MDATEQQLLTEVRQMILDANPHKEWHPQGECELCDYVGVLEAVIDDRLTPLEDEPDR
jgi:hypothetical protein